MVDIPNIKVKNGYKQNDSLNLIFVLLRAIICMCHEHYEIEIRFWSQTSQYFQMSGFQTILATTVNVIYHLRVELEL